MLEGIRGEERMGRGRVLERDRRGPGKRHRLLLRGIGEDPLESEFEEGFGTALPF